jgi:hypothetical protein
MRAESTVPVQAIVVAPTTHLETIAAAAIASGLATLAPDLESPYWDTWVHGLFTKSVRRVSKESQARRIDALDIPKVRFSVGGATAWAFAPTPYAEWPKDLSRLQVSGLDLRNNDDADEYIVPTAAAHPHVVINRDVDMTTGKAAAQAAHAACLWLLHAPKHVRDEWQAGPGLSLTVGDVHSVAPERIEVHDSGLTEIAPNTLTAVVGTPPAV